MCRHTVCVEMVQQKNGPDAAAVLRAMLHATQGFETQPKARLHHMPCRQCASISCQLHVLCMPGVCRRDLTISLYTATAAVCADRRALMPVHMQLLVICVQFCNKCVCSFLGGQVFWPGVSHHLTRAQAQHMCSITVLLHLIGTLFNI